MKVENGVLTYSQTACPTPTPPQLHTPHPHSSVIGNAVGDGAGSVKIETEQ